MSAYPSKLEQWEDLVNQGVQLQHQNGGLNQVERANLNQVSLEIQQVYKVGESQARINGGLHPIVLQRMQKMEQLYRQIQQLQAGIQGRGSGEFGQQPNNSNQFNQQQPSFPGMADGFGQQPNNRNQFRQHQPSFPGMADGFGSQPNFQNESSGEFRQQQSGPQNMNGGFKQQPNSQNGNGGYGQ